jgi:cytochrome c551
MTVDKIKGDFSMRNGKLLTAAAAMTLAMLLAAPALDAAPGATEIYKSKCATCHGADGKGQTPVGKSMKVRDLTSADVQKQTDSDLQKIVADGKAKMPAYKEKLSVADISSLVAYIRGLAK